MSEFEEVEGKQLFLNKEQNDAYLSWKKRRDEAVTAILSALDGCSLDESLSFCEQAASKIKTAISLNAKTDDFSS